MTPDKEQTMGGEELADALERYVEVDESGERFQWLTAGHDITAGEAMLEAARRLRRGGEGHDDNCHSANRGPDGYPDSCECGYYDRLKRERIRESVVEDYSEAWDQLSDPHTRAEGEEGFTVRMLRELLEASREHITITPGTGHEDALEDAIRRLRTDPGEGSEKERKEEVCPAVGPHSVTCELPPGHDGQHRTSGDGWFYRWSKTIKPHTRAEGEEGFWSDACPTCDRPNRWDVYDYITTRAVDEGVPVVAAGAKQAVDQLFDLALDRPDPDDGSEGRELDDKFLACPKCRSALYRCGTYGDSGRPGTLTMCSECPWRGVLIDDMDTIERSGDPDREPVAWRWRRPGLGWNYMDRRPEGLADNAIVQPLYAPKEEGDR